MFQNLLYEALQFNNKKQRLHIINKNYLELIDKYNNLQDEYNRFCIKSAVIKPINLHINEMEKDEKKTDDTEIREKEVCTLHGFYDLYEHVLKWSKMNAEAAAKLLSSITMLKTFPGFSQIYEPDNLISEKKKVIDNWNLFPYLSYLQQLKNNMISISRAQLQMKSKDTKTLIPISYIIFQTNRWFQEFINVYENAKYINQNYYPKYENLENYLYTKLKYFPITRDANSNMVICKNYSLDIPYHLSRFAGLISKINFTPHQNIPLKADTFTDIELLLHYTLAKNTDEYKTFLEDPKLYFACTELGSKHTLLLKMLYQTVVEILESWKPIFKFRNTSNKGIELVESDNNNENSYHKINVPDIIVKHLTPHLLENILSFERFLAFPEIKDYNHSHIYKESPLGKFLNFDKTSRAEFIKYFKLINPENPLLVSAKCHTKVIGGFYCVAKVYSMLIMACLCFYNMSDLDDDIKFDDVSLSGTLESSIRYNSELNTIYYASSLEIFPGLLFYTFLGANENPDDLNNTTNPQRSSDLQYKYESGLSSLSYFKHNKYRTDFFNLFAMYASQLTLLSNNSETNHLPTSLYQQNCDSDEFNNNNLGIRWVTRENLQILSNSVPEIAECQAHYCTLLAQTCNINEGRRLHSDNHLNQYFLQIPLSEDYKHCTPTVEKHYNLATFYKLPVVFMYQHIVAEKPKQYSSLGFLLQNITEKLNQTH
jgi:hypothetical protein